MVFIMKNVKLINFFSKGVFGSIDYYGMGLKNDLAKLVFVASKKQYKA
jgi:hypothetical protein